MFFFSIFSISKVGSRTFLALADLPALLAAPVWELRTLPGRSRESARRVPGDGYTGSKKQKQNVSDKQHKMVELLTKCVDINVHTALADPSSGGGGFFNFRGVTLKFSKIASLPGLGPVAHIQRSWIHH